MNLTGCDEPDRRYPRRFVDAESKRPDIVMQTKSTPTIPKLHLAILFFAIVLVVLFRVATAQATHAQLSGVRIQEWTQTTTVDFERGEATGLVVANLTDGELCLATGATTGIYTSTVFTASGSFNAVAPHWHAAVPDGTTLQVELRAYTANNAWSPWYPFDETDWIAGKGGFYPETPLLLPDGQKFQYRATLTATVTGQTPILDEITITAIDASAGPTTSQARAAARSSQVTTQGVPSPAIIPRAGWGADESLRYDENNNLIWPLEYRPVTKIVVHHTVSSNDYAPEKAAGLVRAIYSYHAITRGWGDIGYNYLVDRYGNIYEGRYGGPGVVGGHVYGYNYGSMGISAIGSHGNTSTSVPPTNETLTALADLAAWEANRDYIHPLESAPFYDVTTPNLAGHRDYGTTACPGDYLYAELPALRQKVWERIVTHVDQYYVEWLAWNTPPKTLLAGETCSLTMQVRNTGWFTWPRAGLTNAVYLGYRWLDSSGQPAAQPSEGDLYTSLAQDVTFGHTYDFEPAFLTTPITPGVYTLAWDMAHKGIVGFHEVNAASPLLTTTLTLTNTPPVTIAGQVMDVRGRAVSGGQVAMPNWMAVTAAEDGAYALPQLARAAYTLTASADAHLTPLPAYGVDARRGDVTYPFVLVPEGFIGLAANGDFENGLTGWVPGGDTTNPPVSTTAAHTGLGAAQLGGHILSGDVWLSQTIDLPANALSPTLSLLYRVPAAGDGATFQVVLASKTAVLTHTLALTPPALQPSSLAGSGDASWTHFWTDLPGNWESPVDLQLQLTQNGSSTPATVLVDEVLVGHQGLAPYVIHLPLVVKAYAPGECVEQIANGSFEETAAWTILETVYPAAYTTDQAHSGARALRAGIEAGDDNILSYSSVQQTVTLPSGAGSATLTYWWYPVSDDPNDRQYLLLLDSEGSILDSLLWTNANDRAWLSARADLTAYAGQTLTLRFGVYNDGAGGLTRLYLDDVSLQVCPPANAP